MNEDDPAKHDPFHENTDLIRAIEDAPPRGDIALPQPVLFKLERTRQEALQARGGALPAAGQNQEGSQISRSLSPKMTAAGRAPLLGRRFSPFIKLAAVLIMLATITWLILPRAPTTARIIVTAPGDEITSTQPVIAWTSKDRPGQKYDIWILPAEGDHLTAPALFVAKSTTSPVAFSALQPGKDNPETALSVGASYRILVCLADMGRTAGVPVPFKVKNPSDP